MLLEKERPRATLKEMCRNCIRGPNLIKTLIIIVCLAVVMQQITACVRKLISIPVTTYTHFDFNKTIMYPSVTFCREPPYKYNKLLEHGLYGHPRYTSTWATFNFSSISLDDLWREISYEPRDIFVQYGLAGSMNNVLLSSHLGFIRGQCHTLSPTVRGTRATQQAGYSVTLQHSADDIDTSTSTQPPGYHVFVHYTNEPYTEIHVYNGGLVDYLYVNTGETIDVKLTVDKYIMISSDDDPCVSWANYSANKCTSAYVWDRVSDSVGCSVPWMKSSLPRCDNYTSMRRLISLYVALYDNHDCPSCPRACDSYLYNAFVTNRQQGVVWDCHTREWEARSGDAALQTQLYIHFNSMMVSVYEENYNYDWNLFISDLGGSIGFLLGLSVISLMTMVAKLWCSIVQPYIKVPKMLDSSSRLSVTSSASTVDVKLKTAKELQYVEKCKEWNMKNDLYIIH